MKTTSYFREVVCTKYPGIEATWIQRVMAAPLEERRQADGRYALWGLVPVAQRETVHNANFS